MSVLEAGTAPAPVEPRYRPHPLVVARARRISPSFRRLTLAGPALEGFGAAGWDQRIKLLLPTPAAPCADAPEDWYGWWRALPEAHRPVMRTYTVRAHRPHLRELDVDVVLHGVGTGHAGPVSSWAATATAGDPVVVVGPTAAGTGRTWGVEFAPPPHARRLLLAGDETAVPAVCSVLESLPPGVRVTALLEVPCAADALPVLTAADADVRWLPREGTGADHGQLLTAAVRRCAAALAPATTAAPAPLEDVDVDTAVLWDVPEVAACGPGELYAWLAGEAGTVRELRRHLVQDLGVPRGCVAFMGYWRRGRAEHA